MDVTFICACAKYYGLFARAIQLRPSYNDESKLVNAVSATWCVSAGHLWLPCVAGGITPRSGHRSVANHESVFVFGGYHGGGHKLFREVWKFDIHREEWELLQCTGEPPTSVASSSGERFVCSKVYICILASNYI
jgi:hypothetical protein